MWDWYEISDLWQSKQNIPFGRLNFSYLYFCSQLWFWFRLSFIMFLGSWFLQFLLCVVAQKMLKALFVLISICIHAHQERSSHLHNLPRTVFIQTIKCWRTLENWVFMSYFLEFGSYFTFQSSEILTKIMF